MSVLEEKFGLIRVPSTVIFWAEDNLANEIAWVVALRNYVQSAERFENVKAFGYLLRFAMGDPTFMATCPPNFIDEYIFIGKFLDEGHDQKIDDRIYPTDDYEDEEE